MAPMSTMQMTFYTSTTTPLYSIHWQPSNVGQYAGTCIFLIVLATIVRALLAFRAIQEQKWQLKESARRYVIAAPNNKEQESSSSEDAAKTSISSLKSVGSNDPGFRKKTGGVRPWRVTEDVPRACIDVVIVGLGYLLMLAVMTGNVGYFMSVLGGTFLGSLAVGRYSQPLSH